MTANDELLEIAFTALWAILAVAGFVIFYFYRNAAFKRRWWPRYVISGGALFLGFMVVLGMPPFFLLFAVPFVALILWGNLQSVRFCDNGGRTTVNFIPFLPPKHCVHCGAPLP